MEQENGVLEKEKGVIDISRFSTERLARAIAQELIDAFLQDTRFGEIIEYHAEEIKKAMAKEEKTKKQEKRLSKIQKIPETYPKTVLTQDPMQIPLKNRNFARRDT
jgi:hypothetical protein